MIKPLFAETVSNKLKVAGPTEIQTIKQDIIHKTDIENTIKKIIKRNLQYSGYLHLKSDIIHSNFLSKDCLKIHSGVQQKSKETEIKRLANNIEKGISQVKNKLTHFPKKLDLKHPNQTNKNFSVTSKFQ